MSRTDSGSSQLIHAQMLVFKSLTVLAQRGVFTSTGTQVECGLRLKDKNRFLCNSRVVNAIKTAMP